MIAHSPWTCAAQDYYHRLWNLSFRATDLAASTDEIGAVVPSNRATTP